MQTHREAAYPMDDTRHDTVCHSLHFPGAMLRDMRQCADNLERDLSWCLRMAWSIACGEIADRHGQVSGQRMLKGRKLATRIDLPVSTWLHIALEAECLDRSHAWMLQRAWVIARPRFSKLER